VRNRVGRGSTSVTMQSHAGVPQANCMVCSSGHPCERSLPGRPNEDVTIGHDGVSILLHPFTTATRPLVEVDGFSNENSGQCHHRDYHYCAPPEGGVEGG
jgi:hypothetical protein